MYCRRRSRGRWFFIAIIFLFDRQFCLFIVYFTVFVVVSQKIYSNLKYWCILPLNLGLNINKLTTFNLVAYISLRMVVHYTSANDLAVMLCQY